MLAESMHHRLLVHCLAVLAAVLATLLLVAGCGDEGGDDAKSLSIEATEPAKDSYAFEAPASIEAGLVDIEFKNSGKLGHEAQFIKIEGNHTTEQALKAFDKIVQGGAAADWFRARGGVGTIDPGTTAKITQRLEPGSYLIIDSGEPEGRDVQPHYRQGAVAELTVTGDPTDVKLPDADATITAAEYQFTPSGDLKAGKNTIEFRNAGAQWHHLIVAKINPGSTIDDVKREIETEKGPPIAEVNAEETAVIDGGEAQLTEVDLTPGSYALMCFIPDRTGGPPHVAKGMISEAKVP